MGGGVIATHEMSQLLLSGIVALVAYSSKTAMVSGKIFDPNGQNGMNGNAAYNDGMCFYKQ